MKKSNKKNKSRFSKKQNKKNSISKERVHKKIKGGMEPSPVQELEIEPIYNKLLGMVGNIMDESSICIDIQGITAQPDNNPSTYDDESITYFNDLAPNEILRYLKGYNRIVILWQGDKSFHKKDPRETGIGATISKLYKLLIEYGIKVSIICVADMEDECENIIERLRLTDYVKDIEWGSYDVINLTQYDNKNLDQDDLWKKKLSEYYGENIINWEKWNEIGKKSRISNLIKQYFANITSNVTFILDYDKRNPDGLINPDTSISAHYNEQKLMKGGIVKILN